MISEAGWPRKSAAGARPVREALLRLKHEGFIEVLSQPRSDGRAIGYPETDGIARGSPSAGGSRRSPRRERPRWMREPKCEGSASNQARGGSRGQEALSSRQQSVHEIKARAARNATLEKTIGTINGLARRFWYAYIEDTGQFERPLNFTIVFWRRWRPVCRTRRPLRRPSFWTSWRALAVTHSSGGPRFAEPMHAAHCTKAD